MTLILALLPLGMLEAQGVAMVKRQVTREELARAIESNDTTVLRATPSQFLAATQRVVPNAGVNSIEELARYIRALEARPCPPDTHQLSRVLLRDRSVDWNVRRAFRAGEVCLFDNNLGQYVLSTLCGNLIMPRTESRATAPAPLGEVSFTQVTVYNIAEGTTAPAASPSASAEPRERREPRVRERSRSQWPIVIATAVVTSAVAYAIASHDKKKSEATSSPPNGGPVNPPSIVSFGLQLRF